ncbi:MAG: hypothetical protein COY47_06875, partial [Chloroflexi bacterium CG_4_10_14_0_8_um_filter_57_5]
MTVENNYWSNKRVVVTGGAGFLGSFITKKLIQRSAADILIPRIEYYNLVDRDAIRRLLDESMLPPEKRPAHLTPEGFHPSSFSLHPSNLVIIHLAARVGGIGANLEHPAE